MRAMPELTRRRDPEAQHETWLIHYGDIQVDVIAERVGNPISTASWQRAWGFYPGSHQNIQEASLGASSKRAAPSTSRGSPSWPSARTAISMPIAVTAPSTPGSKPYGLQGLQLPTQAADGRAVCFCGAAIGIDDMNEHVYTAHMEPRAA
jgi:hypothetical protein